ncbi:hypothetical protein [Streptomyces sp. NPDC046939]|uniref:hypothetical protein n=1 Tax=Streptomyces sp. NPDC046939 TaxID=3155376 RepID=UPI0033C96E68
MRAGLFALGAASAAVVLGAAPVTIAQAGGSGGPGGPGGHGGPGDPRGFVTVVPATVRAGSEVELRVGGCDGTTGQARSTAFVAPGVLAPASDASALAADGTLLVAEARVKSTLAPGTYRVEVTCAVADAVNAGHAEDVRADGVVRVAAESGAPAPAPTPTALVHAGGGGAAARLAARDDSARVAVPEGPGTRHAVIGLALTAMAAVAVAFRTVRRRRAPRPPRSAR